MHCFQATAVPVGTSGKTECQESTSQVAAGMREGGGSEASAHFFIHTVRPPVEPPGSALALAPSSPLWGHQQQGCRVLREADIQHVCPSSGSLNFAIATLYFEWKHTPRKEGDFFSLLKQEKSHVGCHLHAGRSDSAKEDRVLEENIPRQEGGIPGLCDCPPRCWAASCTFW